MKSLLIIALIFSFQSKPFKCPEYPVKVGNIYEEIDLSYNKRRMMEYLISGQVDSLNYQVRVIADSKYLFTDTLHRDYFLCSTPVKPEDNE